MYLGIDVGSVSTDAVLMDENSQVVCYSITKSGFDHKAAIEQAINEVCSKSGITRSQIKNVVGTGYGRRNVQGASKAVTEISCHAMGIHFLNPDIKTVIDIGGQDSKVIHVSDDGFVETFIMNDKCAAGTGRFLDVMAHAMGVELHKLGEISVKAKRTQRISSICTVFAESEVISKIAEGCQTDEIIAGIHQAIGERILSMASAIGIKKPVALTGGVAKNIGVEEIISKYTGEKLFIPEEPQIVGAIGAAIYAKGY
ncbi:MAG: acyl-CoA dehydratase activase [Bacillota bacterium]